MHEGAWPRARAVLEAAPDDAACPSVAFQRAVAAYFTDDWPLARARFQAFTAAHPTMAADASHYLARLSRY